MPILYDSVDCLNLEYGSLQTYWLILWKNIKLSDGWQKSYHPQETKIIHIRPVLQFWVIDHQKCHHHGNIQKWLLFWGHTLGILFVLMNIEKSSVLAPNESAGWPLGWLWWHWWVSTIYQSPIGMEIQICMHACIKQKNFHRLHVV